MIRNNELTVTLLTIPRGIIRRITGPGRIKIVFADVESLWTTLARAGGSRWRSLSVAFGVSATVTQRVTA